MPTRNTSTRGRHTCSPPDQYALSNLKPPDINHYDVFTLASPYFWQRHEPVITGFFHNLRAVGSRGLLVSRRTSHCDRATKLGFKCVTSCHHPHDAMLSKEKWHVLRHFLRFGKAVMAAGADVRLLAPVRSLFRASGTTVDMTFDGRIHNGRIYWFTPDLLIAFATPRSSAFVEQMLRDVADSESTDADVHVKGIRAADVDGEANLNTLRTHQSSLAGPAEQDLLFDSFVSFLHNTTLWARKRYVARQQLDLKPLPHQIKDEGRREYSHGLPRLEGRWTHFGFEAVTPRLRVLLTSERMVLNANMRKNGLPCGTEWRPTCGDWEASRTTLALHCGGKAAACLDLSLCPCLSNTFRQRVSAIAAAGLNATVPSTPGSLGACGTGAHGAHQSLRRARGTY